VTTESAAAPAAAVPAAGAPSTGDAPAAARLNYMRLAIALALLGAAVAVLFPMLRAKPAPTP
jgi:hypothetical protein